MLTRGLAAALLALVVVVAPAQARVKPVAALSGPATVDAGQKATFDATSSKVDPAGEIVEYAWDLDGDGAFEEVRQGPRITIIPEVPGPHELSVRVTDDAGASSTALGHYLVVGEPPVARLTGPAEAVTGQPVTFDAAGSSSPSGAIEGYQWDLDGGGWGTETARSTTTTTFDRPGTYTVALRVRDAALGYGTARHEIVVSGPAVASALGGSAELGIAPLDGVARRWLTNRRFAAINGAPRRRLAAVRRGLWVNLLADRPVRFVLGVHLRRKAARKLGLRGKREIAGHVRVARKRHTLPVAGQRPVKIVLPPKVRRALRKPVRLLVRGVATDADGNRTTVSRAFALRR